MKSFENEGGERTLSFTITKGNEVTQKGYFMKAKKYGGDNDIDEA